jgi:hypothetical protein
MLDERTIQNVSKHGSLHQMELCTCPCYDALMTVGKAVRLESDLRVALAKASPEALAALTIGAAVVSEENETPTTRCESVLFHGPGHQSRLPCEEGLAGHRIHLAFRGAQLLEWVGMEAMTDFFDQQVREKDQA